MFYIYTFLEYFAYKCVILEFFLLKKLQNFTVLYIFYILLRNSALFFKNCGILHFNQKYQNFAFFPSNFSFNFEILQFFKLRNFFQKLQNSASAVQKFAVFN